MRRVPTPLKRTRKTRVPMKCIALVAASLLAGWVLVLPLSDFGIDRLAQEGNQLKNYKDQVPLLSDHDDSEGATFDHDARFAAENFVSKTASPRFNAQMLSDLEVVKRTKADEDAARVSAASKLKKFTKEYCDLHFGQRWLQNWNASQTIMCSPHQYSLRQTKNCMVKCRKLEDSHMTNMSAPHVMCDATNMTLHPSRLYRASCPKHRPGYMCSTPTYHRYKKGAFEVTCEWPSFSLEEFPRDHLRDIFEAFEVFGETEQETPAESFERTPVLLVTRESKEYFNVYHTFTDLLNAFITLRMLMWDKGSRRVIFLDHHHEGPLDGLWAAVVAGGGKNATIHPWAATDTDGAHFIRHVEDLTSATQFSHAAFVPPGYSSLLFAFLYGDNECPMASNLFKEFREFVLHGLGINPQPKVNVTAPLKVVVVSRKPYAKHAKVMRQIGNEEALLGMMQQMGGLIVKKVDLTQLSVVEQIHLLAETDILIGMHGAALTYSMLMPPFAALIELWPQRAAVWRCYEHMAAWSGLLYGRWENPEKSRTKITRHGDVTEIDVTAVHDILAPMAEAVTKRRHKYHDTKIQPFLV